MKPSRSFALVAGALAVALASAGAQEPASIQVVPDTLRLAVGDSVRIEARVLDADGNVLTDVPLRFFSRNRRALAVSRDGLAMPKRGGTFEIFAFVTTGRRVSTRIAVIVAFPPIERVAIGASGDRFFVGGTVRHDATVIDAASMERADVPVRWSTSDESIATVSQTGLMTAHREGTVSLRATAQGVTGEHRYEVVANPIRTVTLSASADSARTGDVIVFSAQALDARGRPVEDAPVTFALVADPEDSIVAQSPPAEIDDRGRFVAERPGAYTVMAIVPGQVAYHSVRITNRHVSQRVQTVGQGAVRDVRTSDLWVWEGVDGRDYAVTGTWGAQGTAYFWDVTNPAAIELIDSIVVDARTVNDVKVSEDGRICVISREGASNRRNGLVILDCTDPHNVEILSTFDDGLTGGVHNLFVYRDHIYAVNNGRKYDIINIEDPRNPRRVGVFELDAVGHAVHDVWIVDGIAYSSNWGDGVVLVDVGNGIAGGTPSHPVQFAQYSDFGGATHAAFPYRSPTGRFYVFMGDEIGRANGGPTGANGRAVPNTPDAMSGWIHVVDFTDPESPEEVARYEVPEAGSHNFWIEGDKLYASFYNGGTRVVDISGELKGNLGRQGREIARFMAFDPDAYVANAPFSWGPQLYKGHIFIAEHNSGLWSIKLQEPPPVLTP